MNYGLSERVRAHAKLRYIQQALESGRSRFSIAVKELQKELESEGFPPNHTRQVCKALTSNKLLRENNLTIDGVDGPPSKTSTTVVVHYRLSSADSPSKSLSGGPAISQGAAPQETPEEWASRLTGKICGILKDELAEYGGGDAFIRWVRGYDEEDAA